MKTLVSKIVVIVALMCATSMNAQNNNQFDAQLKNSLSVVNVNVPTSIVKVMNDLKHMENQYPDAWLPTYYRVFYALQYAARDPQSDYSSLFLDAVKDDVEALQTKNDVDRSELFTLKGFYYTALITQNPIENGKLYYRDAISCYKSAIAINPTPTDKGKRLKIFYATQVATKPPTFVIFVNEEELMHFSYLRFLENQIRKAFVFEGTPIHLIARKRK